MDISSYIHKSVELLFQMLGLVEAKTHSSMELSPDGAIRKERKKNRMH